MIPYSLLTCVTLAASAVLAPSSAALQEGGTSSITVLGQEEDRVVIVVQSQEAKLSTLRVDDGGVIEDTRVPANADHTHNYRLDQRNDPLGLRPLTISLLDDTGALLVSTNTVAVEPLKLADEPSLTLTPAEILDLQKRWPRDRRTGHELDKLKNRCDHQLLNSLEIPVTGGAWTQLYRCPDTNVYLQMITFTQHRSPATGKEFRGFPYDECITTYRHRYIGKQAYEMALAYVLTDDDKYAQRVRQILVEYAMRYEHYEYHDRNGLPNRGGGKAFPLSLDEAEWLIDLARAYDLLQGYDVLTDTEEQQIVNGLLRPAIEVINLNDMGVHNIQVWHNTALFLAGLHAKDYIVARQTLHSASGLAAQFQQGVNADGLWWENSPGYHFNTIRGMLPMIQGLIRTTLQADISRLENMMTAAFELKLPDHTLPLLNDGAREGYLNGLRDEYEQVIKLFPNSMRLDDPISIFGRGRTLAAVLYGPAEVTREGWSDLGSNLLEQSGLAVLRSGPYWQRTAAVLDFGTHGGGHGHFDKLGMSVWVQGNEVVRESGSDGYGNAVSENFFPSTLAHSTVVINGLDQNESDGCLGYFETKDGASTITACADQAYTDVTQRRLMHTTEEGHFADMFEVEGTQVSTIDYVIHAQGTATTSLALQASSFGFGGAYSFLTDVQSVEVDEDFEIQFTHLGNTSTLMLLGEPGTTVFLAKAPGYPLGSKHPVVVVRRTAQRTVFAAAITEGATIVPGFTLDLVDDGSEPVLLLNRPVESDLRTLSFVPEVGN